MKGNAASLQEPPRFPAGTDPAPASARRTGRNRETTRTSRERCGTVRERIAAATQSGADDNCRSTHRRDNADAVCDRCFERAFVRVHFYCDSIRNLSGNTCGWAQPSMRVPMLADRNAMRGRRVRRADAEAATCANARGVDCALSALAAGGIAQPEARIGDASAASPSRCAVRRAVRVRFTAPFRTGSWSARCSTLRRDNAPSRDSPGPGTAPGCRC